MGIFNGKSNGIFAEYWFIWCHQTWPCFRSEESTLDGCHSTLTVKMLGFIMCHRPFSFSRWTDQFWIVTLITNARAVGNELVKSGDGRKKSDPG